MFVTGISAADWQYAVNLFSNKNWDITLHSFRLNVSTDCWELSYNDNIVAICYNDVGWVEV